MGPQAANMGFSEKRGALIFGAPFKGILFYMGSERGAPMLGNAQMFRGLQTKGFALEDVARPGCMQDFILWKECGWLKTCAPSAGRLPRFGGLAESCFWVGGFLGD